MTFDLYLIDIINRLLICIIPSIAVNYKLYYMCQIIGVSVIIIYVPAPIFYSCPQAVILLCIFFLSSMTNIISQNYQTLLYSQSIFKLLFFCPSTSMATLLSELAYLFMPVSTLRSFVDYILAIHLTLLYFFHSNYWGVRGKFWIRLKFWPQNYDRCSLSDMSRLNVIITHIESS